MDNVGRYVWLTERRVADLAIVAQLLSDMNLPSLAESLIMVCEAWDTSPPLATGDS